MALGLALAEGLKRAVEEQITEWRVADDLTLTRDTWSAFVEVQVGDEPKKLFYIKTVDTGFDGLRRSAHEVVKIYAYDGTYGFNSVLNDYGLEKGVAVDPRSLVIPGTRRYRIGFVDKDGEERWMATSSGMRDRFKDWPESYEDGRKQKEVKLAHKNRCGAAEALVETEPIKNLYHGTLLVFSCACKKRGSRWWESVVSPMLKVLARSLR